jgi:hypothetical protein
VKGRRRGTKRMEKGGREEKNEKEKLMMKN